MALCIFHRSTLTSVYQSTENPGRIWWCPTGPLTFLPIHAAGIYTPGEEVTLSDYAISSYTPTVSSLTDLVRKSRAQESSGAQTKLALVAVTDPCEGQVSLPGAAVEIRKVAEEATKAGISTSVLVDAEATKEATIAGMKTHSCVHLACHAMQDERDSLSSNFILTDDRLSLSSIMSLDLGSGSSRGSGGVAELAFLSACQTGAGSNELSEEAVHLAAGMMGAGYTGVVATMWPIPDLHAPTVAQEFYRDLFRRSGLLSNEGEDGRPGSRVDVKQAAYSLNHAMRTLRKQLDLKDAELSFLAWVPYVHFGL